MQRRDTVDTPSTTDSVGWSDLSESAPITDIDSITELPTPSEAAETQRKISEIDVPDRLPAPETTLYADSRLVIRLLRRKTTTIEVELRLYCAADHTVDHIVAESDLEPTSQARTTASRLTDLPTPTQRLFEAAVDAVTAQFSLHSARPTLEDSICRKRRENHGFCGVLEFGVTLRE